MYLSVSVNVDDAVDDMFRQIRGVSDDISGALKSATTGIRHKFPSSGGYSSDGAAFSSTEDYSAFSSRGFAPRFPSPLTTPYSPFTDSELSERLAGASVSEDEYGGTFGGNVHGLGSHEWQSDSDVHLYPSDTEPLKTGGQPFASGLDLAQSRLFASRMEGTFSNGHSPLESYASETVADVMAIPHEVFCHNNTSAEKLCKALPFFEIFSLQFSLLFFRSICKNRVLCLNTFDFMKVRFARCS